MITICRQTRETEIGGCTFAFEDDNLLRVTVGADAESGIYQVYCDVSNHDTTVRSREGNADSTGLKLCSVSLSSFVDVPDNTWYRGDVEIAHKMG